MLADLPSVEEGNFTQTQAGQAPTTALEAMETDEGEGQHPTLPSCRLLLSQSLVSLPIRRHNSSLHILTWVHVYLSDYVPGMAAG